VARRKKPLLLQLPRLLPHPHLLLLPLLPRLLLLPLLLLRARLLLLLRARLLPSTPPRLQLMQLLALLLPPHPLPSKRFLRAA
jgi:hypothetical protein